MHVVVCGLGYVGVTVTACLLEAGHRVSAVDVDRWKVSRVCAGKSPIVEPGVEELLQQGLRAGRLQVGSAVAPFLADADLALVCVGTPGRPDGTLNPAAPIAVAREIGTIVGAARWAPAEPLLVVFRSTFTPGTMESEILPAMAAAVGEPPGQRYEVAFNPEFLREATAIKDYRRPPRIVIGERCAGITRRLKGIYADIDAPIFEMSYTSAEAIKFADNAFHGLKVAFGNELGRIFLALGLNPAAMMKCFVADTRLNISPAYLCPGGPFGGSCLPKDIAALCDLAGRLGIETSLLRSLLETNDEHKKFLAARVASAVQPGGRILLAGLTFKPQTDDLRQSPWVDLARALIYEGFRLTIYDPNLAGRPLVGQNLRFAQSHIPNIERLLVNDPVGAAAEAELIVFGQPLEDHFAEANRSIPRIALYRL